MATISYLDTQIGKILDELERLKMDKNTIVVFLSDHGFHAGEHGQFGKWTTFELGTQVPLIIKTPEISEPGQASDSIVEIVDLYPTIVELTNLPRLEELSGVSIIPILNDPKATIKEAAFSQTIRPIGAGIDIEIIGSSIRTDRYRYNVWIRQGDGAIVAEELYELTDHQYRVENLIDESDFSNIKEKLREKIMRELEL